MRVTNKMLTNSFLADMKRNLQNLKTLEQQGTSGKRFSKPSDDPFKVARSMQLHTEIDTNKQYNRNIQNTINWLDTTDTSLGQVGDVLKRVRELLVSAGNAGYGESERRAVKDEINQKIGEVSQILNTNFDGTYIFGGTRGTTKPVDTSGGIEYKDALKVNININDLNTSLKTKDIKIELKDDKGDIKQTVTLTKDTSGNKFKNLNELSDEINKQINQSGGFFADKLNSVPSMKENSITFVYDESKLAVGDSKKISITSGIAELNGKEIQKSTVIDSGNTQINYYDKNGGELQSNNPQYNMINSKLKVQISQGVNMDYNVNAAEVLEGGGKDLREIFNDITKHLDSKAPAEIEKLVNDDLQNITESIDNILKLRSEVGAKQNRMDSAKEKNVDETFNMTEILSKNEDIDITEHSMKYATMISIYMSSLQTSAKVMQPTLVEYLR